MLKKISIVLVSFLMTFLLFFSSTQADVGNFNDYDSDGGWDAGSWNDDDEDDDRYLTGNGYYNDSGGGGGDLSDEDMFIVLIVLAIIVLTYILMLRGPKKKAAKKPRKNNITLSDNTNDITAALVSCDPHFSAEKFIAWSKEVFITLQQAWYERDWAKLRPFEKEELYKQHERQIREYIERGWINVLGRININNAYLYRYERDSEYEYLTVFIQSRMTDYIKDENTNSIIKGNPNEDSYGRYLYTFMRKKGVKTAQDNSTNAIVACPHCGAPTNITSAGKCEYCGFIVTTGDFSWVLSDIEGVKVNSVIKQGGVFINSTFPAEITK